MAAPWEHLVPKGLFIGHVSFGRETAFLEDKAMSGILVALNDVVWW